MNTPTLPRLGRRVAIRAFGLLALGLLFLAPAQFQQPAHSQSLASPAIEQDSPVSAGATAARTPCATPNDPPGDRVRIFSDDEILLSYRLANDDRSLNNTVLDRTGTSGSLFWREMRWFYNLPNLDAVGWLANTAGDLNGDGSVDIVSAFRNHSQALGALSDTTYTNSEIDWYDNSGASVGSTVSWIDAAAGDLDRGHDNDEVAVAFKDNNSDIRLVALDGSPGKTDGTISNAVNNALASWTASDAERGDVNHVTVATGDLNGDGANDEIVVAFKDSGSDLQVEILRYQAGTATLKEIWHLDSRENGRDDTASSGTSMFSNVRPIDVTTGDLDGDMKDEALVAFRIGYATSGDIQLLLLDETAEATDQSLTVDSSVWKNHNVADKHQEAATTVSVSAADLDGDGVDEIALGYNGVYVDECNSGGGLFHCNTRWIQHLVTYEYVPFAAPEFTSSCSGAPSERGCLHQRSGSWSSPANYGYDRSIEAMVTVATGDVEQDTKAEIGLAHYKFDTDDIEVLVFDADSGLTSRWTWAPDMGSNYPLEFTLSMGDRDGDSRYATYTGVCYNKMDARVVSVIFAPPHWPQGHVASNYSLTGASFDSQALQAIGESTEVSTKIGGSVTVGPSIGDVGASFTYGWEKEASASKSQTTSTESGLKYSTCPVEAAGCSASPNWTGIQFVEATYNCFVYNEPVAGDMDVCLPTYTRSLPHSLNWWYTTGYSSYRDSWVPVGHNLAQGHDAIQSSEDASWPSPAGRAVDGDVNGAYAGGSVSHTGYPGKAPGTAWWEVDLGGSQWIGALQIWNRTDAGYTNRLKDFYVFVSEQPFPTVNVDYLKQNGGLWKQYVPGEAGRPTTVPVDARGRYIRVQLFGPDAGPCNTRHPDPDPCNPSITATASSNLDMAELQVYGMPGAVDQWPKAQPVSAGSDKLTLTWPSLHAGTDIVQTVGGQLLGVDSGKTSLAEDVQSQTTSLGFGQEGETIVSGSTSEEMKLGMEIGWVSGEVSTSTTQKTSHILSWGNHVGFYGDVNGLPAETVPPTICPYQYDFSQYAWLQRSTSAGGVDQAFLVGGYWVSHMGPPPGKTCDPTPPAAGPAVQPAAPVIDSPTHPDPAAWVGSSTATFTWAQPPGDPATIAGYNWTLDQSPDTVPYEINHGPTATKTYEQLADGVWYVHVRAVSDGGLWSDAAHRAIRVDANPPKVELALEPAEPSGDNGWYVTPVTAALSASDGSGSGVSSLEFSTDAATWQSYAAPLTFDQDTPGTTVYARAGDAAGHVSEPVTTTLKIDRTPPDSHVAGGDGPGAWAARIVTNTLGNEVLALVGSIAENGSGRSGMSLEYDGLDWTGATAVGAWPLPGQPAIEANWYFTVTHEIGAGNHIFLGRAQDLAGNQEQPYEIGRVLWYPQAAPDIAGSSLTPSASVIRPGEVVTFTIVARNAGWQEAHVSVVDALPAGLAPVPATLAADVSYDAATGTLAWPARLLWPGESMERTFQARAAADLPATVLENRATLHAGWPNTELLAPAERQRFLDNERTFTVKARVTVDPALPAAADRSAPWVILARAPQGPATSPQVELGIPAAADAARMYLREWTPDRLTGAWTVAQSSGWMSYARTFTWTLSPGQGVKYLGVWVADAAGNVSTLDEHSLISVNRMDGPQSLADGERVQYRGYVEEGMHLMLGLKTVAGDPDLYAWRPRNAFRPDRYTQATISPGQVEESGYQVIQQSGRVLLEVQAVGPSEYELSAAGAIEEQAAAARALEAKPVPGHPLTVSDPLSAGQLGPGIGGKVFLPVVLRSQ